MLVYLYKHPGMGDNVGTLLYIFNDAKGSTFKCTKIESLQMCYCDEATCENCWRGWDIVPSSHL